MVKGDIEKNMSLDFLKEAFIRLDKLNENTFDFTDEGISELTDLKSSSNEDETIRIMDSDVDNVDELRDNYEGCIVLRCPVCKTNIFKDKADVQIDTDAELANVDELCPYCGETTGFVIVGQINDLDKDVKTTKTAEDDTQVQERFKHTNNKPIQENLYRITYFDVNNPDKTLNTKIRAKDKQAAIDKLMKRYDDFQIDDIKLISGAEPNETSSTESNRTKPAPALVGGRKVESARNRVVRTKNESLDNPLKDARSNIIEFDNGEYVYVEYKDGKLIAGTATNTGIIPEYEIPYDADVSVDVNLQNLYDAIIEEHPEFLDESVTNNKIAKESIDNAGAKSRGNIYDLVLKLLGNNGYDVEDKDVQNYSEAAAEYIEMERAQSDGKYSVRQWFKDTQMNYPDDLKDLKKVQESITENNIIMETTDGSDELYNVIQNNLIIYKTIQDKIAKYYEQGKKDIAISAIRKLLFEISRDYKLRTTVAERTEMAKDEVEEYFNFHDKQKEQNPITEDLKDVSVETDTQKVVVKDGVTTIEDKAVVQEQTEEAQVIAPIPEETKQEILNNIDNEEDDFDAFEEDEDDEESEMRDVEIDDIQEESFNTLGSKFLKTIYENVQNFNTSNAIAKGNQLILEGIIEFKSGVKKKTQFIFEAKDITKTHRIRFLGENAHICKGKKPFMLSGYLNDKTIVVESLNYNFTTKDAEGKSTKVRGTVSNKK